MQDNPYVADFMQSIERLELVLEQRKDIHIIDASIFRFKFTYELCQRLLVSILVDKGANNIYSPKDVIKAAFQARLIENDHLWLDMLEARNKTSHMYKESMAEEVYTSLPAFLPLLKKLAVDLS